MIRGSALSVDNEVFSRYPRINSCYVYWISPSTFTWNQTVLGDIAIYFGKQGTVAIVDQIYVGRICLLAPASAGPSGSVLFKTAFDHEHLRINQTEVISDVPASTRKLSYAELTAISAYTTRQICYASAWSVVVESPS